MPVEADELQTVLDRVKEWPVERRVELAQGILETLRSSAPEVRQQPRGDLRNLLGLISTSGDAPTDEEIDRLLEEELMRKYGS